MVLLFVRGKYYLVYYKNVDWNKVFHGFMNIQVWRGISAVKKMEDIPVNREILGPGELKKKLDSINHLGQDWKSKEECSGGAG